MKKCLLPFFLIALLFFSSCAKKQCCVIQPIPDFIIADKDGVKWEIEPTNSNVQGDTTSIAGSQTLAGQDEEFTIKLIIGGVGYYTLKNYQASYIIKKSGSIIKQYSLSPTHLNTVTVIAVNQTDQIIQGFFDLKFVKTYDNVPGAAADSISFLNGKFKVSLHK